MHHPRAVLELLDVDQRQPLEPPSRQRRGRGACPVKFEEPPIFSHTCEAIKAHLTIVFAALAIGRYLQDATGMSIKKIVQALRPIQQIRVRIAGHEHHAKDPLTPDAVAILDSLDPPPQ